MLKKLDTAETAVAAETKIAETKTARTTIVIKIRMIVNIVKVSEKKIIKKLSELIELKKIKIIDKNYREKLSKKSISLFGSLNIISYYII